VTSTVVDVRINAAQVQPGYTRVSVRTNGTSSCGGGGWFAFQYAPSDGTSGLVGKAWLASVLAALQSGRSVTITGTGTCDFFGIEVVSYLDAI
jgi:hypothetical protein